MVSAHKQRDVAVDAILLNDQLARRPNRAADHQAENSAIQLVVRAMADSPQTVLIELTEAACALTGADSSGISLLVREEGANVFRWEATSGRFHKYQGQTLPRDMSPCGTVLDRSCTLLMSNPDEVYGLGNALQPAVLELLLVPFYQHGVAVGTLWVVSHTRGKQFVAEDVRVVEDLSQLAAIAYQVLASSQDAIMLRDAVHGSIGDEPALTTSRKPN